MSIHMELSNLTPNRQGFARVGTIAKAQVAKLQFNRSMENLLGHTGKDFFNLQHAQKSVKPVSNSAVSFAEGLKSFFEKGVMF